MGNKNTARVNAAVTAAVVAATSVSGHGANLSDAAKVKLQREAARRTQHIESATKRRGSTGTSSK